MALMDHKAPMARMGRNWGAGHDRWFSCGCSACVLLVFGMFMLDGLSAFEVSISVRWGLGA